MDNLNNGKKFRRLNGIDDFNRETLAKVPSNSINTVLVVVELQQLIEGSETQTSENN